MDMDMDAQQSGSSSRPKRAANERLQPAKPNKVSGGEIHVDHTCWCFVLLFFSAEFMSSFTVSCAVSVL